MTFEELLKEVSPGYPDALIMMSWNAGRQEVQRCGDSLAVFIVQELHDLYDADHSDEEQLSEAEGAIHRIVKELDNLHFHIQDRMTRFL